MFTITKEFAFSASHVLDGLPDGHQCGRLHGHNYVVTVELSSEVLDSVGFVRDYGELAPVKALIDTQLDHRHLNDVLPDNPTAEHMALWLAQRTAEFLDLPLGRPIALTTGAWLSGIGVSETPKTWAWYRP